jgi:N-acetylneuraminic acid mutarotase
MATCTPHNVETNLSCRTCGTPVCPDCAVRTAMGVACNEHAGSAKKEAVTALAPNAERSGSGRRGPLIGGVVLALVIAGVVFLRPSGGDGDGGGTVSAAWTELPSAGLTARTGMAFVSTGRGMIVWGGNPSGGPANDGAMLEMPANTWRPLAPAPLVGRANGSAVWTGSKMIVFGGLARGAGCQPGCALNDGASYDPATDTWAPMAPAPIAGRSGHTAVWVQDRMVVWGGAVEGGKPTADGASYDPATDAWTVLPPAPLEARISHRTVASAHRMLVWGGSSGEGQTGKYFADGAVYSPADNAWKPMAKFPETREGGGRDTFSSVWTGEKMLVWGGYSRNSTCNPCSHEDGAVYDLAADTWTLMSPGPLSGRGAHRALWTGREMLVWGGFNTTELNDGATYNPESDTWAALPQSPLLPRQNQAMVWAGNQAVIWGGHGPHGEGAGAEANHSDGAILALRA